MCGIGNTHYIRTLWIIFSDRREERREDKRQLHHDDDGGASIQSNFQSSTKTTLLLIAYSYYMFLRMWKKHFVHQNCYHCHKTYPYEAWHSCIQTSNFIRKRNWTNTLVYAWFFNRKYMNKRRMFFFFASYIGLLMWPIHNFSFELSIHPTFMQSKRRKKNFVFLPNDRFFFLSISISFVNYWTLNSRKVVRIRS